MLICSISLSRQNFLRHRDIVLVLTPNFTAAFLDECCSAYYIRMKAHHRHILLLSWMNVALRTKPLSLLVSIAQGSFSFFFHSPRYMVICSPPNGVSETYDPCSVFLPAFYFFTTLSRYWELSLLL